LSKAKNWDATNALLKFSPARPKRRPKKERGFRGKEFLGRLAVRRRRTGDVSKKTFRQGILSDAFRIMETKQSNDKYYWRNWYKKHKETRQGYLRAYYQARRELMLEQTKKRVKRHYQRHKEEIRAKERIRQSTDEYKRKRNARERAKRRILSPSSINTN